MEDRKSNTIPVNSMMAKSDQTTNDVSPFEALKTKLWSSIYSLQVPNGRLGIPILIIEFLQSLGIAFSVVHGYSWDNGYAKWLVDVTDGTLLQSNLYRETPALFAAWAILLVWLSLFITASALRSTSNRAWSALLLRFSNYFLSFICGVAYLPFSSVFGSFLSCRKLNLNGESSHIASCWTGINLAYSILSLISFIFLLFLVIVYQLNMVERIPYDTVTFCKAHGRITAFDCSSHSLLIFLSAALYSPFQPANIRWLLNIVSLVLTTTSTYAHVFYGPYYNNFVQTTKVLLSVFLSWSCLTVVFIEALPAKGYEPAIFLYLSGFFASISAVWLMFLRRRRLLESPESELRNEYDAEMHLRFFLQAKNAFWTQKSTVMSGTQPEKIEENYRIASQMFTRVLKRFPSSSYIYTAYACFLFGKCNFNYALTVLSKMKNKIKADFDIAFHVFRMSKQIENIFSQQKGSVEVKNYFKFLELNRRIDLLQNQFTAKKLAFLGELKKSPTNAKRLQSIGKELFDLLDAVQNSYRVMFSLNKTAKVLRRYATFVSNVLGSVKMTKQIVDIADSLDLENEAHEAKHKNTGLSSQAALFDERNAVFVISGDENRLGEILEVNLGAVDMFGFTVSSELIGININVMMSSPFQEMHSSFLRKYLETGFTSVLDATRTVVAKHKLGFVFEVNLYVRQLVDTNGNMTFIGVMSRSEEQPEYIIIDNSGHLCAISRNCLTAFKQNDLGIEVLNDNIQKLRQIHISHWIPEWEKNKAEFSKEHGCTLQLNGYQMHIKLKDLYALNIQNFSVIEIWMDSTLGSRSSINRSSTELLDKYPALATPDRVMSTNLTDDRAGRRLGSMSPRVASRILDAANGDPDQANLMLQNTAANSMSKYEELMEDYCKRFNVRNSRNSSSLLFYLKSLGILFLGWLVVCNIIISNGFSGLLIDISDLADDGIQNMETLRILYSVRSLQVFSSCGNNYTSALCSVIETMPFTLRSVEAIRKVLGSGSTELTDAKVRVNRNLMQRRSSFFVQTFDRLLSEKNIMLTILRGQSQEVSEYRNLVDAIEFFSTSAKYLSNIPWEMRLPQNLGSSVRSVNEQLVERSPTRLFENNETVLTWSTHYVVNNALNIQTYMDLVDDAYALTYLSSVTELGRNLIIMSIIPVGLLLIGIAMYIIPNVRTLVDWQADILSTFIAIPKSIIQWWYILLIRKLEEDAKEEEDGLTTELYLFLQQGDMSTNSEGLKNSKSAADAKDGVLQKIEKRNKISFRTALNSMNQKNISLKLVLFSSLIVVIPLLSLLMLPRLQASSDIGVQVKWANLLIGRMRKTLYLTREAVFAFYSKENFSVIGKLVNDSKDATEEMKMYHRLLIFGDSTRSIAGLSKYNYFATVFYGDACNTVNSDIAEKMVLDVQCNEFDTGILKYGLNNALFSFEQKSMEISSGLLNSRFNATSAARRVAYLEMLADHMNAVVLSARTSLSLIVTDSANFNSNVIAPLQLIFAFIGTIYVYLRVYLPFMRALQEVTKSMHSLLMIFWSFTDLGFSETEQRESNPRDKVKEPQKRKASIGPRVLVTDDKATVLNTAVIEDNDDTRLVTELETVTESAGDSGSAPLIMLVDTDDENVYPDVVNTTPKLEHKANIGTKAALD